MICKYLLVTEQRRLQRAGERAWDVVLAFDADDGIDNSLLFYEIKQPLPPGIYFIAKIVAGVDVHEEPDYG
jgi:hypothetical protein